MNLPDQLVQDIIDFIESVDPSSEILEQLRGITTEAVTPGQPPPRDPL